MAIAALSFILGGITSPAWSPASAADGASGSAPKWQAMVYPKSGGADEPIELRTSGGCPRPADSILGKVYGHGFDAAGTNVIGNTIAGVTPDGPFSAPLAFSMSEFMSSQPHPVKLEGVYRFVVTCRTAKYPDSYGDYVAEVRFTNPGHWVAAAPVTKTNGPNSYLDEHGDPIIDPNLQIPANVAPGAKGGPAGGKGSKGSKSGSPDEPSGTGDSTDASGLPETENPTLTDVSSGSTDDVLMWLLIGGGVAVAAGAGFVLWRRPG